MRKKAAPRIWTRIDAEKVGDGIYQVECFCGDKFDIYEKFPGQKRVHQQKCGNCGMTWRVIHNGIVQAQA